MNSCDVIIEYSKWTIDKCGAFVIQLFTIQLCMVVVTKIHTTLQRQISQFLVVGAMPQTSILDRGYKATSRPTVKLPSLNRSIAQSLDHLQ